MLHIFRNLDRRWVFLLMLLATALPLLTGMRFEETVTPMVADVFRAIDELPEGSRILVAMDYDPAGAAELHPMAAAITRHAAVRGHRLYYLTLWPYGGPMISDTVGILEREFGDRYTYGRNYVNLGFRAGYEGVIQKIVLNLRDAYGEDVHGVSLGNYPITRDVKNIRSMHLIVSVSAGYPGTKEWVQYAGTPFDIPVAAGTTGVQYPLFLPYVPAQLVGILGGIKGAAEYEALLLREYPDLAAATGAEEGQRRMGPQLVAHLLMILLVIAGNAVYVFGRPGGRDRWPAAS